MQLGEFPVRSLCWGKTCCTDSGEFYHLVMSVAGGKSGEFHPERQSPDLLKEREAKLQRRWGKSSTIKGCCVPISEQAFGVAALEGCGLCAREG